MWFNYMHFIAHNYFSVLTICHVGKTTFLCIIISNCKYFSSCIINKSEILEHWLCWCYLRLKAKLSSFCNHLNPIKMFLISWCRFLFKLCHQHITSRSCDFKRNGRYTHHHDLELLAVWAILLHKHISNKSTENRTVFNEQNNILYYKCVLLSSHVIFLASCLVSNPI